MMIPLVLLWLMVGFVLLMVFPLVHSVIFKKSTLLDTSIAVAGASVCTWLFQLNPLDGNTMMVVMPLACLMFGLLFGQLMFTLRALRPENLQPVEATNGGQP